MKFTELQKAVIAQLEPDSMDELQNTLGDIAQHGADGGFHGFIYYRETVKFHDENEDLLWQNLEDDAKDFGHNSAMEFIGTFKTEASDITTLKNLIAWYAAEKVAFELTDDSAFKRLDEEDFKELLGEIA